MLATFSYLQNMWVVEEEGNMVNREITFVPGLYKIFDEILGKFFFFISFKTISGAQFCLRLRESNC